MDSAAKSEKNHMTGIERGPVNLEPMTSVGKGSITDIHHGLVGAQGHAQVLRKDFSTLASLGLGFSITNSWIGYAASFGMNIIYGGPQSVVFGLVVAAVVQSFITCGLSEIASALPSAGGQYHFCYLLSTSKTRRFTGFVVGWFTIIGWWVLTCSGVSLAAISIQGLVIFWFPEMDVQTWHLYLIYLAVIVTSGRP
jgi:choline transport protein